ncbi:MAG TPA: LysM domain-containing protein [Actinomycetes bacterium]|nr:LysM domain-containing protein [Actinomycetes bacterium]
MAVVGSAGSGRWRAVRGLVPTLALVAVGAALLRTAGGPVAQVRILRASAGVAADPVGTVIAALALFAQLLVAYLLLVLLLGLASGLPGLLGELAGSGFRLVGLPSVRRGLEILLGGALLAGVALGPLGSRATAAGPVPAATAGAATTAWADPRRSLPGTGSPAVTTPTRTGAGEPLPGTGSPAVAAGVAGAAGGAGPVDPAPRTVAVGVAGAAGGAGGGRQSAQEGGAGRAPAGYVVAPGDTLWDIAAAHLPRAARTDAAVSAYWRVIYVANRNAVGADPGLIRPGTRLLLPAPPGRTRGHRPGTAG